MTEQKIKPATDEQKIAALEALLQWQSSDHATEKLRDIKALDAGSAQIRRCHAIMQGLVSIIAPGDRDALPVLIDAKKELVLIDAKKELSGEFCADACTTECDALAEADRKKIEELEATLSETERALECGRAAEGALIDRVEKAEALNAALEADYQRIIVEIIPHARPASICADDQLEPPWEVVKRAFGENNRLRALNAEMLEALKGLYHSPASFSDERMDYEERQVTKADYAAAGAIISKAEKGTA